MPRLCLSRTEAAEALGISVDSMERHGVLEEVKVVRLGRRILVPVAELEAWIERHAERILEGA
jgi:excisionase family DNA binding protein